MQKRGSYKDQPNQGSGSSPFALGAVGASFFEIAETVGRMGLLAGQVARRIFTLRLDGAEVIRNLYRMAN